MMVARQQTGYWANSGALFQHAIDVTRDNYVAQNGLGIYLARNGRGEEAIPHFEEVLRLIPDDSQVHNNLGILLANLPGREAQAIAHFEAAVRLHPDFVAARYNLAMALSRIPGRQSEALAHLEAVEHMQPGPAVEQLMERLKKGVTH